MNERMTSMHAIRVSWPAPHRAIVKLLERVNLGRNGVRYWYELKCGHRYVTKHKLGGAVEVGCDDCAWKEIDKAMEALKALG